MILKSPSAKLLRQWRAVDIQGSPRGKLELDGVVIGINDVSPIEINT